MHRPMYIKYNSSALFFDTTGKLPHCKFNWLALGEQQGSNISTPWVN